MRKPICDVCGMSGKKINGRIFRIFDRYTHVYMCAICRRNHRLMRTFKY